MVKPTVISLFSGCGRSSLGYKLAGYRELLAIDFDANAVETFKLNFPEVECWKADITQITGKQIMDATKLEPGQLDILDGSPPCQGFSTAGKRKVTDSRNRLFESYVRLIQELKPKIFVMENVSGMAKGKMKGLFNEILKTFKSLNYEVRARQLNAKYYGVPQSRQRIFFIGVRKDLNTPPLFPTPSPKLITVKQALEKLPQQNTELKHPSGKLISLTTKLKQGEEASKYHIKGNYFNVKKLHNNKPSMTVTKLFSDGAAGLIHPLKNRFLTIPECKRICSFPDDFKLIGSFKDKWARLGNAVMPLQMKAIAQTLKKGILDDYYAKTQSKG